MSTPSVTLRDVDDRTWRPCADLTVTPEQAEFVAPVTRYLALCAYSRGPWAPLAVLDGDEVVGFVMWGVDRDDDNDEDRDDDSLWIGGLVIDQRHQRRGYGRAVVEALVERARAGGHSSVALSYQPHNPARALYAALGFVETGETEGDEVVARRMMS